MEQTDGFVEQRGKIPEKIRYRTRDSAEIKEGNPLYWYDSVQEGKIDWLWEPYIPRGRLTILGGDPGTGKSFISVALVAALTKGEPLPGEEETTREPMNVLLMNVEDDPADIIKPRLRNMQADMTKVASSKDDIILDDDGIIALDKLIGNADAKFVIIDPIVAFLGPDMDMNRANQVRHIMKGLARIAQKRNVAILVVRHNRKESASTKGSKAIYSGMGSIDFTAAVRSELAVNGRNDGSMFLNHIKSNTGHKGLSIRYEIISMPDGTGKLIWKEMSSASVGSSTSRITKKSKTDSVVKQWLFDQLRDYPDGVPSEDVFKAGERLNFSRTRINMVKPGVAVSSRVGSTWYWKLDPTARVDLDDDSVVE